MSLRSRSLRLLLCALLVGSFSPPTYRAEAAEPMRRTLMAQAGTPPSAEAPVPAETPSPEPAAPASQPSKPEPEEEREVTRVPLVGVERGGTLLKPDQFQFDTSVSYGHTTSTRLILTGFSIIPLIILGTLESEKVTSDTIGTSFGVRYGIWKDLQGDLRLPMIYQEQNHIRVSNDRVGLTEETAYGFDIGDLDFGLTYQPLYEQGPLPDLTVSLRARAPIGRSQFDIFEDIVKKGQFADVDAFVRALNTEGLASGAGFWGITGSVSAAKAFDPLVLFSSLSYTYNVATRVKSIAITGELAEGGIILRPRAVSLNLQPGDSVGLSMGFAIALAREISVNFAFSERLSLPTKQNGVKVPDSSPNVATFTSGFTLALSPRVSFDFSGSIGLTPDSPDFTFSVNVPVTINSLKDTLLFWKKKKAETP